MPKISGTKKQKAVELLERLKEGPAIFPLIGSGQTINEEVFKEHYQRWVKSWILGPVQELIPELKKLKENKPDENV